MDTKLVIVVERTNERRVYNEKMSTNFPFIRSNESGIVMSYLSVIFLTPNIDNAETGRTKTEK